MAANPAVTISCDTLDLYDEDARQFHPPEIEFVTLPGRQPGRAPAAPFPPAGPGEPTAAEAKRCWLRIIRRFTEPVPGNKDCRRLRGGAGHDLITICCEGAAHEIVQREGQELDVGDKAYLVLLSTEQGPGGSWVVSTAVPWTAIAHLTFQLPQASQAQPA